MSQTALPPVRENLHAPEVYATEATHFSTDFGSVKITLTSARFDLSDPNPQIARVVIGRLVMPLAGAQALATGLFDFLRQNGLAPQLTPKSPTDMN